MTKKQAATALFEEIKTELYTVRRAYVKAI